jgi:hypothetical protein
MSTARHIRKARKSDPWAATVRGDLVDELPPLTWTPSLPVGEATELPYEDGMAQFRLAAGLRDKEVTK